MPTKFLRTDGVAGGLILGKPSGSWLLDWPTYGRNVSWSFPGSYDVVLSTQAAFNNAITSGTGVAAGNNVLVTGNWTSTSELTGTWAAGSQTSFYRDDGNQPGGSGTPIISSAGSSSPGLWIPTGHNMSFYGFVFDGQAAGSQPSQTAVQLGGNTSATTSATNITMRGCIAKNWGNAGCFVTESVSAGGASVPPTGLDIDMEITNIGLNISNDPHGDGSGIHAAYIGGTNGTAGHTGCQNSKFSFYSHDISGTWGDVQIGQGSSSNEFWIRSKNLTYRNTVAHPSGTGTPANWNASAACTVWGNANDNGNIVHTLEGITVYGLMVQAGSLNAGTFTFQHGRGHNALVDPDVAANASNNAYQAAGAGGTVTYTDCI